MFAFYFIFLIRGLVSFNSCLNLYVLFIGMELVFGSSLLYFAGSLILLITMTLMTASTSGSDRAHSEHMELTTFTWLALAPVLITIVWTKIARQGTSRRRCLPPPPVAAGFPFLGSLPALLARGPLQAILDAHAEMGSVFTLRLLHREVTFLVGPDVSSHFYQGLDSEMSQDEVSQFTIPIFGPGVGYDVDFGTRREQFRFFGDAMKPAKLRTYAGLMVREVEEYFARWGESGTVDLKQELEHLVTLLVSRCVLGEEARSKMLGEVAARLRELSDGMRLVTILFPHLPIRAHRRRDTARARLGEIFSDIVRSRNAASSRTDMDDDMLQCLIDSRYKDGRSTTEAEVVGMLVSALFAGQHTSSSTGTWIGARLLAHDNAGHLRAAAREQERIMARHGVDRVDYDVLQEMETLHRCVKETLRLHPPAMVLLRHARRSFTVRTREGEEYEVPEGRTVASPLVVHHRLPYVYEDPERYEPGRFGVPGTGTRAEDGAFAYTAFGGGRHACIGEAFAYMQMKVIWSHLLRNFEMEMVSPFPETDWNVVLPGPKGKVLVTYKRKTMWPAA